MMRSKNGKHSCTLLAVLCGKRKGPSSKQSKLSQMSDKVDLPPTESPHNSTKAGCVVRDMSGLVTAGQIEVHVLECPKRDEVKQMLESLEPEFLYFQGDHVPGGDEIGPLEFADGPVSSPDSITTLFGDKLPELVYLETAGAGKLGEVLQNKGVAHVIFWKGPITFPWAAHFRQALIAVLRSSANQVWSAFQLASASFKFYRGNRRIQGTESFSKNHNVSPVMLGDAPSKIPEPPKAKDSTDIDGSTAIFAKVQIYDDDIELPLLVLAEPHGQESPAYGALEDGLNALLTVEVKGMRLLQKVSASPPPSSAPNLVRGVVTMRCDLCTSASARISLLVSGSAQTCFDDQMLEYSIKKELLEKSQLVSSPVKSGECGSLSAADLRKSAAIACGALVREVRFRSCSWGVQVLRQLAPEVSFRSLVALGIAGVQGFPVAAFQREDTDRFSALRIAASKKHELAVNDTNSNAINEVQIPSWLVPPLPSKKRQRLQALYTSDHEVKELLGKSADQDAAAPQLSKNCGISPVNLVAAMRPVPHILSNRDMPYAGAVAAGAHNAWSMKVNMPNGSGGKSLRPNVNTGSGVPSTSSVVPVGHGRQNVRAPSPAQIFSLNTIPMKKHGCNRPPMQECSEEEFRKDVMQFLISRGHSRLVPSTDLDAFPDAVLNGKKLDLYNLYKEVVSRGGFHVGNGINWKGQVFSKMHNHTLINKMTGVGNTLKKHYETFLLEYELAHDDVDGECCILCHSSAAGDWVNCGICGEWAHLGCDKRSGLGAFKEYAKTDGLEYICPRCSAASGRSTSSRKRFRSPANGYS